MLAGILGGTSSAMDPTGHFTIGDRNTTTFTIGGYPNIDNLKNTDPNLNAGKPKAYMNCLPAEARRRQGYCSMNNSIWSVAAAVPGRSTATRT